MNLTGVRLQYRDARNFLKPVPNTSMNLTALLLVAGLAGALPSSLLAAKTHVAKPEAVVADKAPAAEKTDGETDAKADPELAKLNAAKRKVHDLPEVASAQQQAKADRAMAAKAATEYKHARTKAAESETAYRKAYDEALAKADPEAADILKKQRAAFREKMLKARAEKGPAAGKANGKKVATASDDEAPDEDRGEG